MLKASNLSRWQFIQEFSIPPLVAVPRLASALLPIFGLLYVLIFALAVVGNGAVLVLLCRRKALQSPSTFFICSLALSDLLISIVCVPATLLQHFFTNWLAGDFLCKLIPFLQVTAIGTSMLTMTCIAVERFQGILYPLHVRNSYFLCHAFKMLVAVWLVALVTAAPMWFVQKVETLVCSLNTGQLDLDLDSEFLLVSMVQILGFSNSVCNPLVYAALNTTFKSDLLALLTRGCSGARGCCCSSCSCWSWRSHRRVGISAVESVEPRRGLETTFRQGGIRSCSKPAWDAEPERPTSNMFPPMNLLSAIRPKKTSSTMILSVIDPPHTNSTSGSDRPLTGIPDNDECVQPLASGNVDSVSMDGPKVYWKFLESAGTCRGLWNCPAECGRHTP
ncbi:pyroglutamylated RFamide peptide receptor-like [Sinocyclocheilus grahami]|uniref:pyroglutamylated RFamide peptide receptor-like n=1 Tax=Sinocyclocheilus grahami TaxID=75366 RepID=UPI0007AD1E2B|nr:PREDICTED: pyroglutamylated RFamide peptide receptor-like [Sinocyclocheilus grahami]